MKNFKAYLEKTKEIGYVEQVLHTIVYITGLPEAQPYELVVFEEGQLGQVFSLTGDYVEVILLTKERIEVGAKVTRTGEQIKIPVGDGLLGKVLDPLGAQINGKRHKSIAEYRPTKVAPPGINARKDLHRPFETGISIVDLVISLGMGQRELVVGDRKSGKTPFLLRVANAAAIQGQVVVYCAIAKKRLDIKMIEAYFKKNGTTKSTVLVAAGPADPAGIVYLSPYTAMTIAEYFRDTGRDVLIIFDDLTAHAKYYREITLLGKRFPGRSSYPGDIFYIHSRLLERAGNFILLQKDKAGKMVQKEVAITCLPVAELVAGDLSGYIQTNLMAMTDGHIYFDINYFNEGKRPAVNPFLSVTRVGRQTQTPLVRDLNRELTSFLVKQEDLGQFMHFGTELADETRKEVELGKRIGVFLDQPSDIIIPLNISCVLFAGLWAGYWGSKDIENIKRELLALVNYYKKDQKYKKSIDALVSQSQSLDILVGQVKKNDAMVFAPVGG